MYYDDYFEPSEYDIMMDEFKQSIIKNVKQDIKDEIDSLKKENAELKNKLEHLDELEAAASRAKFEAQNKIKDSMQEAKKLRIDQLFEGLHTQAWKAESNIEYIMEKCDKCDDKRKIHFFSPSGREYTEDCQCAKQKYVYSPKEVFLGKVYISKTYSTGAAKERSQVNFYINRQGRDFSDELHLIGDSDSYAHREYYGQDFDNVDSYRTFFYNKEDCERYCAWKNLEKK